MTNTSKCNGITKGVVKKKIAFEDSKETLFKTLRQKHSINTINILFGMDQLMPVKGTQNDSPFK
ncbi:hypothetical protein MAR_021778 [Mya arenaria]|uniref:Uncharacterized protein n=1 Tax=Mya arenaria TaxID=6604 RepID=A0ABY7EDD8_MYAAR|nr:hypothetical protein MAR_021778 [Mya arenaria]